MANAMWKLRSVRIEPLVWGLVGAALDAAALLGLWILLNSIGPVNHAAEAYLDALALVTVPWLVHVIALPALFHVAPTTWLGRLRLADATIIFITVAGILIPGLGFILSLLAGTVLFISMGGNARMSLGSPTWADQMGGYVVFTIVATIVGAAVGLLLHGLSASVVFGHNAQGPRPSFRSNVLGAAVAAFLAFTGMFAASSFGLFRRQVTNDQFHVLSIPPLLPATLVIGVLALLPHLLMVGWDLFPVRQNDGGGGSTG